MRALRALAGVLAVLLAAAPATAQIVTSPAPDSVAVTIYREPGRSASDPIDTDWPTGYALITEKRTVTIPAGRAVIRFEGVAGGMLPESVVVSDLPSEVREKNLDADLLSPRNLYGRSFGRPVTIRRTLGGRSVEEPAIIRSGPDGAAILQTREGFVAVNCGPSRDELVYDSVPDGLSAKPTLSIRTDSPRSGKVTLTLSYLAWNFDWQANYVATLHPDGKSMDLLAWVTLANGDATSFAGAETMVVAGRLNRESSRDYASDSGRPIYFTCFPHPVAEPAPPPPPPPAPQMLFRSAGVVDSVVAEDIGMLPAVMARQEDLGDLKLYRIPDTTSVASMSQKQVMMFEKRAVPVDILYRAHIRENDVSGVAIALRAQNRKEAGLGLPLPAGKLILFEPSGTSRLLVGEGAIEDKAVNEEVQLDVAEATQVIVSVDGGKEGDDWQDEILTVTNANPWPIHFEGEFENSDSYRRTHVSARLIRKNGRDVWAVTVPANGTATLRYRNVEDDED